MVHTIALLLLQVAMGAPMLLAISTVMGAYHAALVPGGFAARAATFHPTSPLSPLRTASRPLMAASAIDPAVLKDVEAGVLPKAPRTNPVSRVLVGGFFAILSTVVVTGIYPLVLTAALYGRIFDNARRRANDFVVQWWARTTMTLFGAKVTVEGVENLPPADEAVMYVPNHCSFLDIFSLSGYLPRRFK